MKFMLFFFCNLSMTTVVMITQILIKWSHLYSIGDYAEVNSRIEAELSWYFYCVKLTITDRLQQEQNTKTFKQYQKWHKET